MLLLPVCPEAAAPPDEALGRRVSELESRLHRLSQDLQQRRSTIPAYVAQRLETHSRQVVSAAVEADDSPWRTDRVEDVEFTETCLAPLSSELQRCSVISMHADQALSVVERALEQANEATTQLASICDTSTSRCQTSTDRVIVDHGGKENASEAAAAILRRRLDGKQHEMPSSKQPRLR